MKVYFVGAGPGSPDLLTVRAHRLLCSCRICIFAGSLVSPEVISLLPEDAEKHDSAKLDLDQIRGLFEAAKDRDIDLIRLHSGDPSIYGAIREQMDILDEMGVDYEVVPGVSSFQATAAVLKTELTAPEISQTIILTRTSGRTPLPSTQELEELAKTKATLCIFLSVGKIETITNTLIKSYGPDCPCGVVYRATWPDQKIITGTLATIGRLIKQEEIIKTAMIIVGEALGKSVAVSKLYDSAFSHEFRAAAK
jgi:precorrin-4/cobalt-precorrin-4 C11-methyltransferase